MLGEDEDDVNQEDCFPDATVSVDTSVPDSIVGGAELLMLLVGFFCL